jgi:rRNA maturation RNase YbeY
MTATIHLNYVHPYLINFDVKKFISTVLSLKKANHGIYGFTFMGNPELKKINQRYLSHHYNTDIISFNLGDIENPEADIYISVDQAKKNAKKAKHSLDDELRILIVHGILHTLGYEDQTNAEKSTMDKEQALLVKQAEKKISKLGNKEKITHNIKSPEIK